MQRIPATIVKSIIPLILSQLDELTSLSELLSSKVLSLPASTSLIKCNDPRIDDIKSDLKKVNALIAATQLSLSSISKILSLLNTIGRLSIIFKNVGLVIPTTVPGPVSQIVTTFSNTGTNCVSAAECLQNISDSIQLELGRVNEILGNSINVIGNICNDQIINTNINAQQQSNSLINLKLGESLNLSGANFNITDRSLYPLFFPATGEHYASDEIGIYINDAADSIYDTRSTFTKRYVSKFYNQYNVSNDDINDAITVLNTLYNEQKAAVSKILRDRENMNFIQKGLERNLVRNPIGSPDERTMLLYQEPPSNVYFGKSILYGQDNKSYPSLTGKNDDIFNGGKQDDFFIDTENNLIYGPKESISDWGTPIKY
jgi:hypothetical protein